MEKEIRQEYLTGERALFKREFLKIYDTIFYDGESPLKESHEKDADDKKTQMIKRRVNVHSLEK